MPILLDLSQVAIAGLMASPNITKNQFDDDLIRHMILNSIRAYKVKFGAEYGEIIICCDAKKVWRYDVFPQYKANRKKNRGKSAIDWDEIFRVINLMKNDLREYFPYKVVEVEGAEADDVIAVLTKHADRPVMIIGGDKDYGQLHKYPHVKQWSPKAKKLLKIESPEEQLNELIIIGDKSDGIPNIKTSSSAFADGKRSTPIRKTDVAKWKSKRPEMFCENKTMLDNWVRNQQLIDFDMIPEHIQQSILEQAKLPANGTKMKVLNYLSANRMRNLLKDVDQF